MGEIARDREKANVTAISRKVKTKKVSRESLASRPHLHLCIGGGAGSMS